MLSIRLSRVGKKKAPMYRMVVMPKTRDPWAKSTEILGHYNPRVTPKSLVLNTERLKHWLAQGAQATDTVWNLLIEHKLIEGEKRSVTHLTKKRSAKMADTKKAEEDAKAKAKADKEAAEAAAKEAEAAKVAAETAAKEAEATAKSATEAPVEAVPEATSTETPAAE